MTMLNSTKWLLMAEIKNERNGGDYPTTLVSALESVLGGYNPDFWGIILAPHHWPLNQAQIWFICLHV
jgi:hypothetical protein